MVDSRIKKQDSRNKNTRGKKQEYKISRNKLSRNKNTRFKISRIQDFKKQAIKEQEYKIQDFKNTKLSRVQDSRMKNQDARMKRQEEQATVFWLDKVYLSLLKTGFHIRYIHSSLMQLKICLFFTPLLFSAIVHAQKPAQLLYKNYVINRSLKADSSMINLLQPYADSLDEQMNTVIGFSNVTMYQKPPECALGNFMADCLKLSAGTLFKTRVDAAILNFGSIRSYLPKGDIKLQTMYDLMPFDNLVVVQKINGNILHQWLDLIAYKGGWPLAGITMKIRHKTASDIVINGAPLNDTSVYTIATLDYLANGGGQCSMLKNIAQLNKNYLYRDALINYVKAFTSAAKPVFASIENRITNESE